MKIRTGSAFAIALLLASSLSAAPPRAFACEHEVTFPSVIAKDLVLHATLHLPTGASSLHPVPVILLVTPDLNDDNPDATQDPADNPSEIARHVREFAISLSEHGYAVLMFDPSQIEPREADVNIERRRGSPYTLADYAEDTSAAIGFLQTEPNTQPATIAVCGIGSGNWVAAHLLASDPVPAASILLGCPTQSGYDMLVQSIATEEVARSLQQGPDPTEEAIEQTRVRLESTIYAFAKDDLDRRKTAMKALIKPMIDDLDIPFKKLLKGMAEKEITQMFTDMFTNPQIAYLLRYDPLPQIREAKTPMLAFYARRNTDLDAEANAALLSEAFIEAGDPRSKVTFLDVEHCLDPQAAGDGEAPGMPPLVEQITAWLDQIRAGQPRASTSPQQAPRALSP